MDLTGSFACISTHEKSIDYSNIISCRCNAKFASNDGIRLSISTGVNQPYRLLSFAIYGTCWLVKRPTTTPYEIFSHGGSHENNINKGQNIGRFS